MTATHNACDRQISESLSENSESMKRTFPLERLIITCPSIPWAEYHQSRSPNPPDFTNQGGKAKPQLRGRREKRFNKKILCDLYSENDSPQNCKSSHEGHESLLARKGSASYCLRTNPCHLGKKSNFSPQRSPRPQRTFLFFNNLFLRSLRWEVAFLS